MYKSLTASESPNVSQSLSTASLAALSAGVTRPAYVRDRVTPGIVHLGIGAFHRAHQAVYVDDILSTRPDWGIIGASLRRPDTRDALAPQDGLYTVAIRDASGSHLRVIGSVLEVIDANVEREWLIALMADPAIRIVSLTVTEKGYCHDPATGELDEAHPDIVHDLTHPGEPHSAPGLICAALDLRRSAGVAPFTVMSCDNLPANGKTARRIVTRLADRMSPELGTWVAEKVAFPSSMVDRIVPATTDEDRAEINAALGLEDAWPVVTEPFTQWVIEDDFPAGRPPFEMAGAEMTDDVEPFEHMKLRMLNGAHSSIAYLGYLAGYETVSETVADPAYRSHIHALMTGEVIPTLNMPGTDLEAYRDQLLERFANPALKHRTWQIAMDGSQKLPQRLLGTIRDRLAADAPIGRLTLGVAAWMRFVTGIDEKGEPIDVRDPMADRLRELSDGAAGDPQRLAEALMSVREVFGTDLPSDNRLREAVTAHLKSLFDNGARATVEALVG
jgi:fructuronate reductase